jgi:hypothetical protein
VHEVSRLSGASLEQVWGFFATGMLLNVTASLDLEEIAGEEAWARAWSRPPELPGLPGAGR